MTREPNTHHVVHFTLVPIGGSPEVNDRRQLGVVLGDAGFQPQVDVRVQRIKLIDHLKPRLITEVIDTGKVGQKVEAELLLGEFAGCARFDRVPVQAWIRRESPFAERSGTAPGAWKRLPPGS